MAKKTYGEALFTDPELKTPAHDAIMLWLDENALDVFKTFDARIVDGFKVDKKVWEAPIKTKAALPVGYVDMYLSFVKHGTEVDIAKGYGSGDGHCLEDEVSHRLSHFRSEAMKKGSFVSSDDVLHQKGVDEYALIAKSEGYMQGSDGFWQREYSVVDERVSFNVEVKPSIRSIGELIRQIRRYESVCKAPFVVVSPDDRFANILRSQGIGFIKAPYIQTGAQGCLL